MDDRDIRRTTEQLVLALSGGGQTGHFDKLCSTEHLFASWDKFVRGKRSKPDVQSFARKLEENIFNLQMELRTENYRHGDYQPFIIHDPKRRQIHKATVRDRLVHQAVFDIVEPAFERRFIFDSYSCRLGKGTHAGVKRLRHHLNRASRNNSRTVYALRCDIRQFFSSVDHDKLLNLLSNSITDEKILKLLKIIIDSFSVMDGKGIPLGNVTSQLFANVYMHQLDWYIKYRLRQKYYIRYCDDFILISANRQELVDLIPVLNEFLRTELTLSIHPSKISVRSWSQGIDFLGYVTKPNCTLIRTKTKNRILKKVKENNLSSYLGVCAHADSYELRQILLSKVC